MYLLVTDLFFSLKFQYPTLCLELETPKVPVLLGLVSPDSVRLYSTPLLEKLRSIHDPVEGVRNAIRCPTLKSVLTPLEEPQLFHNVPSSFPASNYPSDHRLPESKMKECLPIQLLPALRSPLPRLVSSVLQCPQCINGSCQKCVAF